MVALRLFASGSLQEVLSNTVGISQSSVNRIVFKKNFHSINGQIVCDASLKITNLVATWPGSTHDPFILTNSALGQQFSEGQLSDGWLLGQLYIYIIFLAYQPQIHFTYYFDYHFQSHVLLSSFKSEHAK